MNALNNLWLRQYQKVIITFQVRCPVCKTLTTIVFLFELMTLNHSTHCAINNQNTLGKKFF